MNIRSELSTLIIDKEEHVPAFANYLGEKGLLDPIKLKIFRSDAPLDSNSLLKRLWRSTSLSSHEFANEVAAFFGLRRMTLLELTEFRSLADRFAPRFLRDASIFPFETGDGTISLAAGDPADAEALRAAEIVLGAPFEIVTASFDDIAVVLGDKLEADEAAGGGRESGRTVGTDESVDNLRDLASGAPVVRAVNDLIEKAVELRASDIHIEPLRDELAVRMRVDGLLRTVAAPAHVPPQAVVSRVKNSCRTQYCRAASSSRRRGATAGRPRRHRHPRRDDAELSTANPRSCASCRATEVYWTFPNSACRRLTKEG